MAGIDTKEVFIGAPEQSKTAGAIATGDVLDEVPEDYDAAVKAVEAMGLTSGYVSEDGVAVTPNMSTTGMKDWSLSTIRTTLDEFSGELSFELVQLSPDAFKQAVGEDNVTEFDGGIHVGLGAHLPPERSWGFRIKDGDRAMVILVPNGQATNIDEMDFNKTSLVGLPVTVTANDDGNGDSIHIYIKYEDGSVAKTSAKTTSAKAAA